jgi:monovalent cation:H+ antiporter-2, CPA2 family
MHDPNLILTLTGGLAAALVCGYATLRLGLSPIVGYLLAGFIVGPHTPGFVANREVASELAEIGVILLMFGVGLQFHLEELLAVRKIAVPGALVQSLAATLMGIAVGLAVGWSLSAGLVFGLAISVASTVVLLRVLADAGDLHTPAGHVAVGWLVVEDLLTVFVLVVLPTVFGRDHADAGGLAAHPLIAVPLAFLKVAALVVVTLFGGRRLIPWVLAGAAATRSRELFTLTVLVLALGIAVASAKAFGVSMALGAFLAGMVVGRSEFSLRAATEALPMRDAFAVLFFVSVGMLFDPRDLAHSSGLVVGTLVVILLGKPLVALAVVRMLGHPLRTAVSVSVALAQIGEFSFILADAGRSMGLLDDAAVNDIVAGAIVSITLNPLYYRLKRPIEAVLRRFIGESPVPGLADAPAGISGSTASEDDRDRVVIVGCGPLGRTLVRLLRENQFHPVVIELNLQTVRRLTDEGITAVYGDAAHRETLDRAGLRGAVALVLSSSQTTGMPEAIRLARELNPRGLIAARANYLAELPALQTAGADLVFAGEGEVALSMTESLLERLGASPDQIDRERDRIHSELFRQAERPATGAGDARRTDTVDR